MRVCVCVNMRVCVSEHVCVCVCVNMCVCEVPVSTVSGFSFRVQITTYLS
jgi:hypothetical protein